MSSYKNYQEEKMPDNNISSLSDSDLLDLLSQKIQSMSPEDISSLSDQDKFQLLEHKDLVTPEVAKAIETSVVPEPRGFTGALSDSVMNNIKALYNLPDAVSGLAKDYAGSPERFQSSSITAPIDFLTRKAVENPRQSIPMAAGAAATAAGLGPLSALFPSVTDFALDQGSQLLGMQPDTPIGEDLGKTAGNLATDATLAGAAAGYGRLAGKASDVLPAPRGERIPITPETQAALGVAERGPGSLGNTLQGTADDFIQNPIAAPSESAALRNIEKLAMGPEGIAAELSVPQGRADRAIVASKRLKEVTPQIYDSRIAHGGDVYDPVSGQFQGEAGRRLGLDDYVKRAETASKDLLATRRSYLKAADEVIKADNIQNLRADSPNRILGVSAEDVKKALKSEPDGKSVYDLVKKRKLSGMTSDEALSMMDDLDGVLEDLKKGSIDPEIAGKAIDKAEVGSSEILYKWMKEHEASAGSRGASLSDAQHMIENINHYERILGAFDEAFEAKQMNGTPSAAAKTKGTLTTLGAARRAIQTVLEDRLSQVHDVVATGGDHLPELAAQNVARFPGASLKTLNDRYAALQPFKDELERATQELSPSAQIGTNAPMSLKSPNRGEQAVNASIGVPGTPIRTSVRNAFDYVKKIAGVDVPTESNEALARGMANAEKPGMNIQAYGQIREGGGLGQFGPPELRSKRAQSLAHKLEATSDYARATGLYLTGVTPVRAKIERSIEGIPSDLPNRLQEVMPQDALAKVLLTFKEAQSTGDDKAIGQVMGTLLKSVPEIRGMFAPSETGAASEFNGIVTDPEDVQLLQIKIHQAVKAGLVSPNEAGDFMSDINNHRKPRKIPSAIKPKKSNLSETIQSILGQ